MSNSESSQQAFRNELLTFHLNYCDEVTCICVSHFGNEGKSKRTVNNILKTWRERGSVERKTGSGRKPTIMIKKSLVKLKKMFNNKDDFSQSQAANEFGCSQQYISKKLKESGIKRYKKKKAPYYKDQEAIDKVKKNSRWVHENSRGKDLVLDDEKYFTLSNSTNAGNDSFYSSEPSQSPNNVKFKQKTKFEPKVMLYIAISPKGISKPILLKSGLAVNQDVYIQECLNKSLLPFIKHNYSGGDYLFWPDKASSHYAKKVIDHLGEQNIDFVPKVNNPTNLPQCRPIEDFFGYLSHLVYKNNWRAKNVDQLKRRIRKCIKEIPDDYVERLFAGVRTNLLATYNHGPFHTAH